MTHVNLPGTRPILVDGNLQSDDLSAAPKVLVLGTAGAGLNYQPILVRTMISAKGTFGSSGTLLRGGYEVKAQRAENTMLMRIGGTAASIEGIGVVGVTSGYKVTTDLLDDFAGTQYAIYFLASSGHLAVYDTIAGEWVYDSVDGTDTGAVCVELLSTLSGGTDIGSLSAPVPMGTVGGNTTYVAGTDGTALSRMEMYEALHEAYSLLDFSDIDFVVPMDVYIDDLNVADLSAAQITARGMDALVDYPTAGALSDGLGYVYIQEYQGVNYFWWDTDNDGVAEIYPSVGVAGPSANIDGTALTDADFHEVNFAYQLAQFCDRATYDWRFVQGFIDFKLPTGYCATDLASWIGQLPTYTTDPVTGDVTIASAADDGTGMLGNKFMAGAYGYRSGVAYGGFISTDSGFMDGVEQEDENEHLIDIGKFINICGAIPVLANNYTGAAYVSALSASYAGMCAGLAPSSAPTNKVIRAIRSRRIIKAHYLDALAGMRIVSLAAKKKGTVITDAPTAARPDSDYQRFTTVRIVKATIDLLRDIADPFLGEGGSAANRAALQTAVEDKFNEQLVPDSLVRYDISITATPAQFVAGQAYAQLVLVPNFELRHLFVNTSLSSE